MKKIVSLVMALCMALSLSVTAFADEISSSGGTASTPVYLSSTEDGTLGGTAAATAMSVTIPTTLPMAVNQQGDVTTATDCRIVNNSYGAVRVKSATITANNGWSLTSFGDKSTLAGEKVNSNKLGFAMSIGGGSQVATEGSASTQALISSPIDGCYMYGCGDTSRNFVNVSYNAIVTPLSQAVTNANVANVMFVVEWDAA